MARALPVVVSTASVLAGCVQDAGTSTDDARGREAEGAPDTWAVQALPTLGTPAHDDHTARRTQDVNAVPDGTHVVMDAATGAYTVRFDATVPVPRLPPHGGVPAFMEGST